MSKPRSSARRGERLILAEAVDDAPDVAGPLALEQGQRVDRGLPRVHDDRLVKLPRQADEPREDFALRVPRRVVVVVVEADLADGRHLGRAREVSQLGVRLGAPADGVVRVDAHARADTVGLAPREVHGLPRLRQILAHADDDEAHHAGGLGPAHDRVGAFGEVSRVEVAVGVDQSDGRGRHAREGYPLLRCPPKRTSSSPSARTRAWIWPAGTPTRSASSGRAVDGERGRRDRLAVTPAGGGGGAPVGEGRPATAADHALAAAAEARMGGGGLGSPRAAMPHRLGSRARSGARPRRPARGGVARRRAARPRRRPRRSGDLRSQDGAGEARGGLARRR